MLQRIAAYCSSWESLPRRLAARDATDEAILRGPTERLPPQFVYWGYPGAVGASHDSRRANAYELGYRIGARFIPGQHVARRRGSKPARFGAAFAPICGLTEKLAEKPGEYRQKSAEKMPGERQLVGAIIVERNSFRFFVRLKRTALKRNEFRSTS